MVTSRALLAVAFSLTALSLSGSVAADSQPWVPIESIKAALSGVRVSAGPDASKLTRSPWGPELYRNTVDSVVLVLLPEKRGNSWLVAGTGSGVIVSANCQLVTNWHVVKEVSYALVVFRPAPPQTLENLREDNISLARVLKTDQPRDLALLQLERCPSSAKFLPVEDPQHIQVGQDVFAIGHPKELYWTYTEGVISQIRPRYRWAIEGREYVATVIQTQTPISYGSSGGPLINQSGRLVGVISNLLVGPAGFNFAISAHELRTFLTQ